MNLNNDVYFVHYGHICVKHPTLESAVEAAESLTQYNIGETIYILKQVGFSRANKPTPQTIVYTDIQTVLYKDKPINGAQVANKGKKVARNTTI
jgi:hypothetical protein